MTSFLRGVLAAALMGCAQLAVAAPADDFFRAIKQDNAGAVRDLLARGFDPNTRDERGTPGLYMALQEGSLKVASALIASPALKPETRTPRDESPLMMAAFKGQLEQVKQLIAKGADVNKPGWTSLHYASTNGHLAVMELLLEEHAFIDAESPNGTTPLMMAAGYGPIEAVKLLLEAGADTRMRNKKGMTALDFAEQYKRPDAIQLLGSVSRTTGPKGTW